MEIRTFLFFNFVTAILISLTGSFALSQNVDTASEVFARQGRYVNVTLQLGEPLKIFVAGKERARFSLTDLKLEVKTLQNQNWEELKLNKYGNYYSADVPQENSKSGVMEVRTTLKNKKSESFKFNLK